MAITIKRNRLPATLDIQQEASRYVERVTADGIELSEDIQDTLFSVLSATGMPTFGTALSTAYPQYLLRRIVVSSVGNSRAELMLYWEVDGFGGTPTVSVITVGTTLVPRATNMIPGGSRIPMRINSYTVTSSTGSEVIPADNVTFNILTPHRVVTVSSLKAGSVPTDDGDNVGYVNNATWRGLDIGYWLLSEYAHSLSKYTGYYQQRISAMSRVIEDWSETGILTNEKTGKYIAVDEADIADMNALDYDWGVIYDTSETGIARFGPFPMTDFSTIFGF